MKFYGDYHTHSVYSDGRAKISDAALYAGKIGLKELAVTDHGFANVTLSLTEKKFEKERLRRSVGNTKVEKERQKSYRGARERVRNNTAGGATRQSVAWKHFQKTRPCERGVLYRRTES